MKNRITGVHPLAAVLWFGLSIFCLAQRLHAEEIRDYYAEPGINPFKDTLNQSLNEHIDPFSGTLQLKYTDVTVPGNGGLDINITRVYTSLQDTDVPLIGINGVGWVMHFGRIVTAQRHMSKLCAQQPEGNTSDNPSLELPDGGRELLVLSSLDASTLITRSNWKAQCVAGQAGMLVTSPDGTKYTMSHANFLQGEPSWLTTRIEDVHGNWIRIEYATNAVGISYITAIYRSEEGNGAPVVTYEYQDQSGPGIRLSAIVANAQRWTYLYESIPGYLYDHYHHLVGVQRPDGKRWTYAYNPAPQDPNPNDGVMELTPGGHSLRQMIYPFGATIDYTYRYAQFDPGSSLKTTTIFSKTVTGSDVPNGVWQFSHAPFSRPYTTADGYQLRYDVTTITAPQAIYRYVHYGKDFAGLPNGNQIAILPSAVGLLAFKETYSASNTLLERHTYAWTQRMISPENYFHGAGYREWWVQTGTYAPMLAAEGYNRDGLGSIAEYQHVKRYFDYDAHGNPGRVYENVNLSAESARQTLFTYRNDTSRWILGLPLTETYQTVSSPDATSGTTLGQVTRAYDPNGKIEWENRFGVRTEYTYTSSGDLASAEDARGYTRSYSNYKRGIARREELPESVVLLRSVNDTGTLQSETNGRGFTTSYAYDELNRLLSIDYPLGADVSVVYGDQSGALRRSLSRGNYGQVELINDFGQTTRTERSDASAGVTLSKTMGFDALGRATFVSYPNATVGITTSYDALGRVLRTTHPDASYVEYTYLDQQVSVRNERAKSTSYLYRIFGVEQNGLDPYLISQPMSVATLIERDIFDNTRRVAQGTLANGVISGKVKTFRYDARQFLINATEPEVGTTVYTHDAVGNVLTETVNDEPATTFTWDGLGRRVGIDFADATTDVGTIYDRNSNVIEASKGDSRWNYSYDDNDNLLSETLTTRDLWYGPRSYAVGYAYSPMDVVSTITYPSGLAVSYEPDAFGRATRVGTFATNVQYHPSGPLRSYVLANGITTNVELNARLLTKRVQSGSVVDLNYTYDPSGNTASIIDAINSQESHYTIEYDDLDRLRSARYFQADYDALGNIRSNANLNYRFNYTLDANSRLTQVEKLDSSGSGVRAASQFGYDSRGNIVSKQVVDQAQSDGAGGFARSRRSHFRFDAASNLIAAEIRDTQVTTGPIRRDYTYDGRGMRYAERQGKGPALLHSIHGVSKTLLFEESFAECSRTDIILLGALNIARSRDVFANAAVDSDSDGLNDCVETQVGLNPLLASDAAGDLDGDGLSNLAEYTGGSSPLYADTDNDGLSDALEAQRRTDPLRADSDGDGLSDTQELADPRLNPNAVDSDHDGVTDDWELRLASDPSDPLDATDDFDGDGFSNRQERSLGIDPLRLERAPARGVIGLRHDVGGPVQAAPAIGRDGSLYVSHYRYPTSQALALHPDGTVRWKYDDIGMSPGPMTIAEDGTVYYWVRVVSGTTGYRSILYARNPDGSQRWAYYGRELFQSPITIGRNGELWIGGYSDMSNGGSVVAVDRNNGAVLRTKFTSQFTGKAPVVAPDGATYAASNDGTVHAFAANGANLWTYPLRAAPATELSLGSGGVIYLTDTQGYSYALRSDGTLLWEQRYSTTAPRSAMVVGPGGVLYLGTATGQLLALRDSDGAQLWSVTISSNQILTPALGKDGTVYAVSAGGRVSAYDSTGAQVWTMLSGSLHAAAPVIDRDGTLYLATLGGQVLSVVDRSGGPALTRWPMHRHDIAGSSFQCFNSVTYATNADSDGDGIGDCDELRFGMDPNDPSDGALDFDGDGLNNAQESAAGTSLTIPDTDGDGLSDGQEVLVYRTNPLATDSDGDMLSDGYEVQYRFDPLDAQDAFADADADGFSNRQEMLAGTNPVSGASAPAAGSIGRALNNPGAPVQRAAAHPDGSIYTNGYERLEALRPNLSRRWSLNERVLSQVTIGTNGIIYAVTGNTPRLVALHPDGRLWWSHPIEDSPANRFEGPAIGNDGSVYLSYVSGSSFVYPTVLSFNANGGSKRRIQYNGASASFPARLSVDRQGRVLYSFFGLRALHPQTLETVWSALDGWNPGSDSSIAAVDSAGVIYHTHSNYLYAYTPNGTRLWASPNAIGHPLVTADGLIVTKCIDTGQLCAFDSSGAAVWQTQGSHSLLGSPAIDANNVLHQVTGNGLYLRFAATGQTLSEATIPNISSFEYPVPLRDGAIYLGIAENTLLMLNDARGAVTAPWAGRNRDSMNRRNALAPPMQPLPEGPAITWTPIPPPRVSYGLNYAITAQARDLVDGDVTNSIQWTSSLDGPIAQGASINLQSLRGGAHTISATAADLAGNSSTGTFDVFIVRQAPSLSITSPSGGGEAEIGYPFGFAATATDVIDGDVSHLITWTSNIDGLLGTGGTLSAVLSTGVHLVYAAAVNSAGVTYGENRQVEVARWPPKVTISTPANNVSIVRGTPLTFTGSALDIVDGNLSTQLQWRSSRDGALYTGASFTNSTLSVGNHQIRAQATDSNELVTTTTITVRVTASAADAAEESSLEASR